LTGPTPLDGIRRVFDAFGGGDARALFEVIDEAAVWTVPGTAAVSQIYDGRARIFDLFRETRRLTDGTYLSELQWAVADDDHAVAVYRARGHRLGRSLDIQQVLLIRHRAGRWLEITAVPTDPPAFEYFWGEE
jgi:ketosteroid isomerase-like protein